jgi:hypothetical protein
MISLPTRKVRKCSRTYGAFALYYDRASLHCIALPTSGSDRLISNIYLITSWAGPNTYTMSVKCAINPSLNANGILTRDFVWAILFSNCFDLLLSNKLLMVHIIKVGRCLSGPEQITIIDRSTVDIIEVGKYLSARS